MNRYTHSPYVLFNQDRTVSRYRDVPDTGFSDVKLIPTPERMAELLHSIKIAEEDLTKYQDELVVSADQIEPHAAGGDPDARLLLDALHRVSADRATGLR